MAGAALEQQTYLPEDAEATARVYDFLAEHEAAGRGRPEPRYLLAGPEPGDQVEIPRELYRALRQVVEALQQGLAVTVAPQAPTLTTQQAADLLGVSRPTLVKLLDEGRLPFERVGTHRRIKLQDVLAYREERRAEQYAALEATAVELASEEDLADVLERLRRARQEVGAARPTRRRRS